MIDPLYTPYLISVNIGFSQGSFVWKCAFSVSALSNKKGTSIFWKRFLFFRKFVLKLKYQKRSKFPVADTQKYADLSN